LCVDTKAGVVYGFGRSKYGWGISPERWQSGEKYYQVHATPIESSGNQDDQTKWRRGTSLPRKPLWSVRSDIEARAMAVTGNHVLIAGPKGRTVFSEPAFRGEEGVALQILDKRTGAVVQEITLPAIPTFDGLIAALGNVYVSLENGSIVGVKPDPVQQGYCANNMKSELTNDFSLPKTANGRMGFLNNASGISELKAWTMRPPEE
jgi:hypothetical protein